MITFTEAMSLQNVQNDEQKEIILKLSKIVAKAFEEDTILQSYIQNITSRVQKGECINLCDVHSELLEMVQNRIKFDNSLRSEIVQIMIENFELLNESKIECKAELSEFLS